jgi:hypothetical protein
MTTPDHSNSSRHRFLLVILKNIGTAVYATMLISEGWNRLLLPDIGGAIIGGSRMVGYLVLSKKPFFGPPRTDPAPTWTLLVFLLTATVFWIPATLVNLLFTASLNAFLVMVVVSYTKP